MTIREIDDAIEIKIKEEENQRRFHRDLVRSETFYLLSPYLNDESKIQDPEDLSLFRFRDEVEETAEEEIEIDWDSINKSIKRG